MINVIASILILLFLILSGIHVYWAFGGRWGAGAVFPTKAGGDDLLALKPPPIPTLMVAGALATAALLVILRVDWLPSPLPRWVDHAGVWVLAAVFALRSIGEFNYVGLFKRVRDTSFARLDTQLYTPLCLLLSLLALIVAWRG